MTFHYVIYRDLNLLTSRRNMSLTSLTTHYDLQRNNDNTEIGMIPRFPVGVKQ